MTRSAFDGAREATPIAETSSPPVGANALVVASAFFLEELDSTVLATALPAMARDFHVDPLAMSGALTAYLVSLAVLLPASSRIADRFGSRTVFAVAIVLFTGASLASARTHTLPMLEFCRVIQGIGGAMMNPVGRLVLLRSVPKAQMLRAMTWVLIPASVAPMMGPPLGGLIVTALSWRWIFYLNLPIGLITLLLTFRVIPQLYAYERTRFDVRGALLSGAALACLIFGLQETSQGQHMHAGIALLATGVAAALLYIRHARRAADPILDFRLMRVPTFRLSVLGGSLTRLAIGARPYLLPAMLQIGFGLSALQSGLTTFSAAIGQLFMRVIARRLLGRFGYRTVLVWNCLSACVTFCLCATFRPDWPIWLLSSVLLIGGISQALQFLALNTVAYADVTEERMSAATALYTTLQRFTLTLGICIAAATLQLAGSLLGEDTPDGHLSTSAFSIAFLVVGALSALALPAMMAMPPDAGESLRDTGRSDAKRAPQPAGRSTRHERI